MENTDKQKQIRSCKIDIPYCISFYERYRLDPAQFFKMPLEKLPLAPQMHEKCYAADVRTLDQLLNLSPNQLVLKHGFCLESLLKIERCLANFVPMRMNSLETKVDRETEKQSVEENSPAVQEPVEGLSSQTWMQEAQEQTYAQIYSLTPADYRGENISAQFLSQYTKKFLLQNDITSVESLLQKTSLELAGMDGASNTNIHNIERFLTWLKDFSSTVPAEKQLQTRKMPDVADSGKSLEDILSEERPDFPFMVRRTTWKRNDLFFVVTHVKQQSAYGYWIENGTIDRNTRYPLKNDNVAWEYIHHTDERYLKQFKLIHTQTGMESNGHVQTESKEKNPAKSKQAAFRSWLSQNASAEVLDDLLSSYKTIERYARDHGLISQPLFETTDLNTIYSIQDAVQQKKEFRTMDANKRYFCGLAMRHYLRYLTEKTSPNESEFSPLAERRERERLEAERRERERLEAERRERERLEAERREQERLEAERRERERLEAERREQERLEVERRERERLEAERREQERLEAERRERERLEAERRERERLEAERREQERLEAERREQERLEAERLEQERLKVEPAEREQLEAELRKWESNGVKTKYDHLISHPQIEIKKKAEAGQVPERKNTESIDCTEAVRTLAELYNLIPLQFNNLELQNLELSVRLSNVCRRYQMITVVDLLEKTPMQLMEMKNFGKTCMLEIERLMADLQSGRVYAESTGTVVVQKGDAIEECPVSDYTQQIASGDFSFLEEENLPENIRKGIVPYLESYDLLGNELVMNCINDPEKVVPLISAFAEFAKTAEQHNKLNHCLKKIPEERWGTKASTYIKVYGKCTDLLCELYPEEDLLLKDILQRACLSDEQMDLAVKFLTWCAFDLSQDVEHLLASAYNGGSGKQDERRKEVIFLRAQKQTLEQIGQKFEVTRERVRQIEGKAIRLFEKKQSRIKLISKINAVKNGSSVVTAADLAEYAEENLQELLFLLKNCKTAKYIYDKDMDLFIVGNDGLQDRIQAFTEQLPDQIQEKDLPAIYKEAEEEYDLSVELADKAIEEVFQKTGSVYHRRKLNLVDMYVEVLKDHYPNGMHVYDPREIARFRGYIAERYGSVKISESDRALSARIAAICVLCDRGKYRLKQKQYIPKPLAAKIRCYIDDSEHVIFMTNTLFDVFRKELIAAGVENKYYLQGILHELFDDRYTFTRDYISKDPKITSVYSSIVNYIRKSRYPVSKHTIQKEFPGVNEISVNIAVSDAEILNYFGEYLHACYLKIAEQEKAYLRNLMEEMLSDGEIHHVRWLYDRIMGERPEILTRNGAMQPFHTFSIMEYLFREEYEFQRPYIAPMGVEIESLAKRLHDFIYTKDEIQISQISEFVQDSRSFITSILEFVNSCNDQYLLADSKVLMSIEKLGVDASVAKTVEALILPEINQTMPIRDLTCWNSFPAIRVPWTEWLVYGVLNKWSEKIEVAPSYNQFRMAIPLAAPAGKMNAAPFADAYKEVEYHSDTPAQIVADDLDQIDDLLTDLLGEQLLEDTLWD